MTTQKPELMPDEISLFRCEGEGDIKWSEDSSDALATYVNEDLYTAACAERDALRALCEGMAGELAACIEDLTNVLLQHPLNCFTPDEAKRDIIRRYGRSLAAYEKHKAGE